MEQFKFHGYIYITINQQTKKCYVGQKSISPEKSKNYLGSGARFNNSIKKYGKKFFKKIVLGEISSNNLEDFKKQLNEAETECIYFFRTYGSDGVNYDEIYGYNLTIEGGTTLGLPKEILHRKKQKEMKTKIDNPEIMKEAGKKASKTKKENPDIQNKINEGIKKFNKNHPEVRIEAIKKDQQKKKENPDIMKNAGKNISKRRYENKTEVGNKSYHYVKLHYEFLIIKYFQFFSLRDIYKEYFKEYGENITDNTVDKFFRCLKFPKGHSRKKDEQQQRISFIEENKYKIQWYIDNYERLEEEYFEKKFEDRYKEKK
jgi:hypothetical protein